MNYPGEPKRRGLALTIIGALLMLVVAPTVFVIGLVVGVKGAIDIITAAPLVQPGGSIILQQNHARDLYAYLGPSSSTNGVRSSTTETTPVPECSVRGPDGSSVTVQPPTGNTSWSRNGSLYQSAGSFTPAKSGTYTITCGDHAALVPAGSDASEAGKRAAWSIGVSLAVATALGIIGVILLIVGIVKLVNSGKERSQHRLTMQTQAWNQGYGSPYRG